MDTNGTYQVADLCEAASEGDVVKIRHILDVQPDLVNVQWPRITNTSPFTMRL